MTATGQDKVLRTTCQFPQPARWHYDNHRAGQIPCNVPVLTIDNSWVLTPSQSRVSNQGAGGFLVLRQLVNMVGQLRTERNEVKGRNG